MKTNKNKKGRKTIQIEREKHIFTLKKHISNQKKELKRLSKLNKERIEYIQKIHNWIGKRQLKEFKKTLT